MLLESFQVIPRFTYRVELYVEVGTIEYLIALDLSIGFFTTSPRREKNCYGLKHKIHIGNKIKLGGRKSTRKLVQNNYLIVRT